MSLFWIIYLAGCLAVLICGVTLYKQSDDLTIGTLLGIIFFSIFSWILFIVILWIGIEVFFRESDKVQKFLNKKL